MRIGEEIYSPLIPHGGADVIIGFEPAEAVRCLPYLKKGGCVVVSPAPIRPVTASLTGGAYTGREMMEYLEHAGENLVVDVYKRQILAFIVYKFGTEWIEVVLPPAAMGPVVALIGLELSGSAASNAGLLDEVLDPRKTIVFVLTLGTAVFGSILFRKFFSVIPIPVSYTHLAP